MNEDKAVSPIRKAQEMTEGGMVCVCEWGRRPALWSQKI